MCLILGYYVPDIRKNLMSVAQKEKKGHELIIRDGTIKIRIISTKSILCIALRSNDLYIVKANVDTSGYQNHMQ